MADSTAGGEAMTVAAEFIPGKAMVENPPPVGSTVLYYPAHGDDFAGGYRGLPAIVVSLDTLAVIGVDAHMTARMLPLGSLVWEGAGSDHSVAHWAFKDVD